MEVNSPGAGADNPRGHNIVININLLAICPFSANFDPLNNILPIFPIQMH